MKRILATLLLAAMLLSFWSCAEETVPSDTAEAPTNHSEQIITETDPKETKETEEKKTEEKKEVIYQTVTDPVTWDDIRVNIPIANASMSTDQLRQICVDFFNLSMTFTYVPNQDYSYVVESQKLDRVLPEGQLTGGVPYITKGNGNLYRLMDHYDSNTGILDVTPYLGNYKVFGNACSGGATWGWARVVNSVPLFQWTWGMTHANGFLKVGPYQYDLSLTTIQKNDGDYGPKNICEENGEQVMFESYAATDKADGIVSSGHVRMVTDKPHVVRNADGTINGKESYLVCSDQICYNTSENYVRTQSDGTSYRIAGGNNLKFYFDELYKGYIPFTFAEFLGTDPVEDAVVEYSYTGENITPFDVNSSNLKANYILSDIYFNIKDAGGNSVFTYRRSVESFQVYKFAFSGKIPLPALTKYADGNHTLELSVQLGNGTRPVFYSGKLMPVQ